METFPLDTLKLSLRDRRSRARLAAGFLLPATLIVLAVHRRFSVSRTLDASQFVLGSSALAE